jgi:hypothetical protein
MYIDFCPVNGISGEYLVIFLRFISVKKNSYAAQLNRTTTSCGLSLGLSDISIKLHSSFFFAHSCTGIICVAIHKCSR